MTTYEMRGGLSGPRAVNPLLSYRVPPALLEHAPTAAVTITDNFYDTETGTLASQGRFLLTRAATPMSMTEWYLFSARVVYIVPRGADIEYECIFGYHTVAAALARILPNQQVSPACVRRAGPMAYAPNLIAQIVTSVHPLGGAASHARLQISSWAFDECKGVYGVISTHARNAAAVLGLEDGADAAAMRAVAPIFACLQHMRHDLLERWYMWLGGESVMALAAHSGRLRCYGAIIDQTRNIYRAHCDLSDETPRDSDSEDGPPPLDTPSDESQSREDEWVDVEVD